MHSPQTHAWEYFRFIQSTRKLLRKATHPTVFRKVFSKSSQSSGLRALQTKGAYVVSQMTFQRQHSRSVDGVEVRALGLPGPKHLQQGCRRTHQPDLGYASRSSN